MFRVYDAEVRTAAEQQEAAARLDNAHRDFEREAISSARARQLALAVAGEELSLERLRQQGFVAKQLTRRMGFEQHLASLVSAKTEQLVNLCEGILHACPDIARIEGDDLLHRNPLISLFETIWRRGGVREPFDVSGVLAFDSIRTVVAPANRHTVKPQIGEALKLFADLKATEAKYQEVRWENSIIPPGAKQATFVTWESSDDGEGLVVAFSASRLKWLAVTWPQLAAELGTSIEQAASAGESQLKLYAWRIAGSWKLSSEWPRYELRDDSSLDLEDEEPATYSNWDGDLFCEPKLAAEELLLAGYDVMLESIPIGDGFGCSAAETCAAHNTAEVCSVTIRWS